MSSPEELDRQARRELLEGLYRDNARHRRRRRARILSADATVTVRRSTWRERLLLNCWRSPFPFLLGRWTVEDVDGGFCATYLTLRGARRWIAEWDETPSPTPDAALAPAEAEVWSVFVCPCCGTDHVGVSAGGEDSVCDGSYRMADGDAVWDESLRHEPTPMVVVPLTAEQTAVLRVAYTAAANRQMGVR